MTMTDLGSQIALRLDRDDVFNKHAEVIFVAHSMGGLLVQQILLTYRKEGLSDKVNSIFLYGTPQEGSRIANLAKIFRPDPLLTELEAGNRNLILHDMDQRWKHAGFNRIERFCAYETLPEKGFTVVERYSATRGCADDTPINADHHHIVEPEGTRADAYTFLKRHLVTSPARSQPVVESARDGASNAPSLPSISPELPPPSFQDDAERVEATFGTLTGGNRIAFLKQMNGKSVYPLDYEGFKPVEFKYANGKVSYSVKFWSPEQHSVIEVADGRFTVLNDTLDRNYSSRALEVVTPDGHPILQIIWVTPGHMQLNGLFPLPNGTLLCLSSDSPKSVTATNPFSDCTIPPIFRYPSWKYQGVLATP